MDGWFAQLIGPNYWRFVLYQNGELLNAVHLHFGGF